jgi:hypothetical protein
MVQNVSAKKQTMGIFLRLKDWQLFGILLAIPVTLQTAIAAMVFAKIGLARLFAGFMTGPAGIADMFSDVPAGAVTTVSILTIAFILLIFCWLYSLGVNLHKKLPQ